jgi:hypothetical protein
MNFPVLKKTNSKLETIPQDLELSFIQTSLHEFLSENNATIYQNNNDLQQAYIFTQTPQITLENDTIQISSGLILNISDYLNQSKSKISLISSSKNNLDDYLEQFGYNRNFTNGKRTVGMEFKNYVSGNLTGFYHKDSISWQMSQLQTLAYTDNFDIELEFQATTDTSILMPTLEKYFSKPKQMLPVLIKQLLHNSNN